jgi:hypothetical protein
MALSGTAWAEGRMKDEREFPDRWRAMRRVGFGPEVAEGRMTGPIRRARGLARGTTSKGRIRPLGAGGVSGPVRQVGVLRLRSAFFAELREGWRFSVVGGFRTRDVVSVGWSGVLRLQLIVFAEFQEGGDQCGERFSDRRRRGERMKGPIRLAQGLARGTTSKGRIRPLSAGGVSGPVAAGGSFETAGGGVSLELGFEAAGGLCQGVR